MKMSPKSHSTMKGRRSSRILLPLLAALAAFSCSHPSDTGYFRTYIQSDPGILDPFSSTDVVSGKILASFCDGLVRISAEGKVVGDLAESWSFDGATFSCVLRRDLRFSDGTPLSASDVVYSLTRIRDSSNPTSPRRSSYTQIASISSSDSTVTMKLSKPNMTFPYLLTQVNSYIISEKAMRERREVIGSGPFRVKSWIRDDRIVLEKNPHHSGEGAKIAGIIFRIIPEDLTARFEFMNGALDYFELPYLSSSTFDESKFTTKLVPELCVHYVALNTSKAPFDNPEFRRALNLAVDRQTIVETLFSSRFSAASGSVPPGIAGYEYTLKPYAFDPARAKKTIARLGLSGKKLTFICKAEHQISLAAQMIQRYLVDAGLDVELREMEWGAMKNVTNAGRYDMALFNWYGDYPDAENFLRPLFHSANRGSGGNRSFYSNSAFDALVEKAALTSDAAARNRIYAQAEELVHDDAPWIYLWYGGRRLAFSKRVSSFVPYPVYNGMKGDEIEMKP